MSELPERIHTATGRLGEAQADLLADWVNLYFFLGRAAQAAISGDSAETRRLLREAGDIERSLLGDAGHTDGVIDALDAEVSA